MPTAFSPIYRYLGQPRLHLVFLNPNHCGAFLCLTALCIITMQCIDYFKWNRWSRSATIMIAFVIMTGMAMTYSRGAFFSFIAVMFLLCFLNKRKLACTYLFLFLLILAIVPKGGSRLASSFVLREPSVFNRLMLWRGMCGLIWEHTAHGIPTEMLGQYYSALYQPLNMTEQYMTAQNDFLTFAATHGIFQAATVLFLFMIPIIYGFRMVYSKENGLLFQLGYCCIIPAGYAAIAMFNTFYMIPLLFLPVVAAELSICVMVIRRVKQITFQQHLACFLTSLGLAMLISMVVLWIGKDFIVVRPFFFDSIENNGNAYPLVLPKSKTNACLVHISKTSSYSYPLQDVSPKIHDLSFEEVRSMARPCAENHVAIMFYRNEEKSHASSLNTCLTQIQNKLPHMDLPVILFAGPNPNDIQLAIETAECNSNIPTLIVAIMDPPTDLNGIDFHDKAISLQHPVITFHTNGVFYGDIPQANTYKQFNLDNIEPHEYFSHILIEALKNQVNRP